jgi:hypothetical protein
LGIGNWARSQDWGKGEKRVHGRYYLKLVKIFKNYFFSFTFYHATLFPMANALSLAVMSDAAIYGVAFFYTLVLKGFYLTGAKMRVVSFDYVVPRFSTFVADLDRSDY